MITVKGTYTVKCPECQSPTIIHVLDSDGLIGPKKCSNCGVNFEGIDNGEGRNTFFGIVKEKEKPVEVKIASKKSSEEKKETEKAISKSSENKSFTFKSSKKSSGKKEEPKKISKKSHFKW